MRVRYVLTGAGRAAMLHDGASGAIQRALEAAPGGLCCDELVRVVGRAGATVRRRVSELLARKVIRRADARDE